MRFRFPDHLCFGFVWELLLPFEEHLLTQRFFSLDHLCLSLSTELGLRVHPLVLSSSAVLRLRAALGVGKCCCWLVSALFSFLVMSASACVKLSSSLLMVLIDVEFVVVVAERAASLSLFSTIASPMPLMTSFSLLQFPLRR